MNRTTTDLITTALTALFLGFLVLAGMSAVFVFDTSYNLISYQSLFQGSGFSHTYNGQSTPFDPTVSTGPELYLPTLLLWVVLGRSDYDAASWALIGYYAVFFLFLYRLVLRDPRERLVAILVFLALFFSARLLIQSGLFIAPLGELVAAFLVCFGLYALHNEKYLAAGLLLGLALDVKANIAVGLLPTLLIFWLVRVLLPAMAGPSSAGRFRKLASLLSMSTLWLILLLAPHTLSHALAPRLFLDAKDQSVWQQARDTRFEFMRTQGMGQWLSLKNNPTRDGVKNFIHRVVEKTRIMKGFFNNSIWLLIAFWVSIILFLASSRNHFSLYLFLFGILLTIWWLTGPLDAWFRYWLPSYFSLLLGIVCFIPSVLIRDHRVAPIAALMLVLSVSWSTLSIPSIHATLADSGRDRQRMLQMAEYVDHLDPELVFTYGWFQCPQIALLTGRRFFDYKEGSMLNSASDSGQDAYFLRCPENSIIEAETQAATREMVHIASFGGNRLYRISSAEPTPQTQHNPLPQ